MNLTAVDAETIIRLATYDIVHLELRATPIHVPENHITYVTENIATHLLRDPSCTVIDIVQKPYRFMAKFHASMKQNIRARKLYTRVILFLLLLSTMSMQVDMLVNSASWYQPLSVPLCSRSSWRTGV